MQLSAPHIFSHPIDKVSKGGCGFVVAGGVLLILSVKFTADYFSGCNSAPETCAMVSNLVKSGLGESSSVSFLLFLLSAWI